jgi:hypothetical protein
MPSRLRSAERSSGDASFRSIREPSLKIRMLRSKPPNRQGTAGAVRQPGGDIRIGHVGRRHAKIRTV